VGLDSRGYLERGFGTGVNRACSKSCNLRRALSRIAADKATPSRAYAKLVEAKLRLGRAIRAGETCVDLGASPGSWTYVAVTRGARVIRTSCSGPLVPGAKEVRWSQAQGS
jgi:23S rRNA C2498 (ribose-2'-O)-methylase RlmM